MNKEPQKPNIFRRGLEAGANISEKLHYGLGAIALSGFAAEVLTGVTIIRPELLALAGLYGVTHGFVSGWIKRRAGGNKKSTTVSESHLALAA